MIAADHDGMVHRFAAACRDRDVRALRELFAPDAVVVTDGGGNADDVLETVRGCEPVARWVGDVLARHPGGRLSVEDVNGRAGVVLRRVQDVVGIASLDVSGGRISTVWLVLNPEKLKRWSSS